MQSCNQAIFYLFTLRFALGLRFTSTFVFYLFPRPLPLLPPDRHTVAPDISKKVIINDLRYCNFSCLLLQLNHIKDVFELKEQKIILLILI